MSVCEDPPRVSALIRCSMVKKLVVRDNMNLVPRLEGFYKLGMAAMQKSVE